MPLNGIQTPIRREAILMTRGNAAFPNCRLGYARSPYNQRSSGIVRMAVSMTSPITHPVVGGEDERRLAVVVEIFHQSRDLLHTLINDFDVVKILLRVRSVRVARSVEPQ